MPCGHPHVDANNVEKLIEKGFRWLMPAPSQSFAALRRDWRRAGGSSFVCHSGRGNAASPEPMNTGFPGHAHRAWVP